VLELGPDGSLERHDPHALGVDADEDPADDAVLPRRVEALHDEEERALRLREEEVLELVDPVDELRLPLLGGLLVQAQGVPRVALGQAGGLSGLDAKLVEHDRTVRARLSSRHVQKPRAKGGGMSVAKIIELTATSSESFEDACRQGLEKAGETIRDIKGAWVDGQELVVEDGEIGYHVHLKVTFVLE
jgi:flavin-binding protein dodecin